MKMAGTESRRPEDPIGVRGLGFRGLGFIGGLGVWGS